MQFEDNPLRRLQPHPPASFPTISPLSLLPHLHSDLSLARTAGPWGESWPVMLPGLAILGAPIPKLLRPQDSRAVSVQECHCSPSPSIPGNRC